MRENRSREGVVAHGVWHRKADSTIHASPDHHHLSGRNKRKGRKKLKEGVCKGRW